MEEESREGTSRQEYWPLGHMLHDGGAVMEMRTSLAWELIHHFGLVSGRVTGQDDAGRAVLDVMPAREVVQRAFELADAFVDTAEVRGGLRPVTDAELEQAVQRGGELDRIKTEAQYPRMRELEESREERRARREEAQKLLAESSESRPVNS